MADTTGKRRVKNPETFRERAIKAAEASEQPRRRHAIKAAGGKATKPVGSLFARLGRARALRPFRRPARLLGRILVPRYIRGSFQELRLVTWPTFRQARQLTVAVMLFAIVFGGIVAGVDYGLDKVFRNVLLK